MKPSTAKAKGLFCENAIVAWLNEQGHTAERRRLNGSLDKGDVAVHGLPICIEVKSGAGPWKMTEWVRQTINETRNAGAAIGLLAIRPARAKTLRDWVGVYVGCDDHGVNLPPTGISWTQVHTLVKCNEGQMFWRSHTTTRGVIGLTIADWPTIWRLALWRDRA